MKPPKVCLLWKNERSALGARRPAFGARVGQSALGPRENRVVSRTHGAWVEFSLGGRRMALGGSTVIWLILGFHPCVLLLRVFSYRWESVTVKVLSLIRKQSIGHCLFWLISNYKAPHFDIFFSDFLGAVCLLNFFRRSTLGARVFCFWVHSN